MPNTNFNFKKNRFITVFWLEDLFPPKIRNLFAGTLTITLLASLGILFYSILFESLPENLRFYPEQLSSTQTRYLLALTALLLLTARLIILCLEGFINSKTANKNGYPFSANIAERMNFYASRLWYDSLQSGEESTKSFINALAKGAIGRNLFLRLGMEPEEYKSFLQKAGREQKFYPRLEFINHLTKKCVYQNTSTKNQEIKLADLLEEIINFHPVFKENLNKYELNLETIKSTAQWLEEIFYEQDLQRRWWRKENLGRIKGIGKTWAYGKSWILENFAYNLAAEAKQKEEELIGKEREVKLIESALLKSSGANVIIVGEPGIGKRTVLLALTRMITSGNIFPQLEYWRVYELNTAIIETVGRKKGNVHELLLSILNEALRVGNIIFAIDNFPEFIDSLEAMNVDAAEILIPYLASPHIHIIGLANTISFRKILEQRSGLMKYFEQIEIPEPTQQQLIEILKSKASEIEQKVPAQIIFTFPALQKAVEGALNYLVEGASPKRAVDLMTAAVTEAVKLKPKKHPLLISKEDITKLISEKTDMPLGAISMQEQKKLLQLEEILHQRIVDQTEAVNAVVDTVRRLRAGIRNPKRPIGTFLFLGPTGVGKTETAKALAEVYFGNEETMIRFDMSEYQDDNSIERLIGSYEKNEPGILASYMQTKPYGLILLDEFEKSNPKIRNLFLQILDEGYFSDYLGRHINMRNTIIIATSNAGAQLIWELTSQGADLAKMKSEIIAHIQKENIFAPELINRFDSIVIFQPLSKEALKQIARIMLNKLVKRLAKNNIIFKLNDELIDIVAKGGFDPAYGARPMQRFIQDNIEKIIAEKIISRQILPGKEFSLNISDFESHNKQPV